MIKEYFKKILFAFRKEKPPAKAPEIIERAKVPKPPKAERVLTVGIDFGTSSIKVIWYDHLRCKHYLMELSAQVQGYPRYCLPSTIRIADERIYFGAVAEEREGGHVLRSVKSAVFGDLPGAVNSDVGKSLNQPGIILNKFEYSLNNDVALRVTYKSLATLLMAYVIAEINARLHAHYGEKDVLKVFYHMAAPLDQLNHEHAGAIWQEVLYLAEKAASNIKNGMSFLEAVHLLSVIQKANPIVTSPEIRNTFIFPETVAGIVSYLTSGKAESGLYGIVDIGAGTTDISFFRHNENSANQSLLESFYAARTHHVGMDDFDHAVMRALIQSGECKDDGEKSRQNILHGIRRGKLNLEDSGSLLVAENGPSLLVNRVQDITKAVRDAIFEYYGRTLGQAFLKEKRQMSWNKWTLFIIGGGSRLHMIRRYFQHRPGHQVAVPIESTIQLDGRVGLPNGEAVDWNEDMTALLAIAYGLSQGDWPEWKYPREVQPMDTRKPVREVPDRDETR